jgi:hypothetical protein
MNPAATLRSALLRAAVPACLVLTACEPQDNPAAVRPRYQAPLLPPRRAENPDPANAQWLAAWRELRAELSPLEEKLAALQQVHAQNNFDAFLGLNPATLSHEQLCSLFHFLQRGYFTVERRVLIHLLERRLDRAATSFAIPANGKLSLKDHLANAMHRDEIRMVDLETAIQYYEEIGEANFQVSGSLTEEESAELRSAVSEMLAKTRTDITEMDAKLARLKLEVLGLDEPPPALPEPPPEPEPVPVPEPEPLTITGLEPEMEEPTLFGDNLLDAPADPEGPMLPSEFPAEEFQEPELPGAGEAP